MGTPIGPPFRRNERNRPVYTYDVFPPVSRSFTGSVPFVRICVRVHFKTRERLGGAGPPP